MSDRPSNSRTTTAQQRRRLFELWERVQNVSEACQRARVSRGTFYRWKPLFERFGYAGLEVTQNHRPKQPRCTPPALEAAVIAMRQRQPHWGKYQIAREVTAQQLGAGSISPNTVRRILLNAGLWK